MALLTDAEIFGPQILSDTDVFGATMLTDDDVFKVDDTPTRASDVARALPGGAVQSVGMAARGLGTAYNAVGRTLARPFDAALRGVGLTDVADAMSAPVPWWMNPGEIIGKPGQQVVRAGEAIGPAPERQNLATDISGGVGQIAGQLTAAILTGGTGATALMYGQGVDQMEQMRQEYAPDRQDAVTDSAVLGGGAITALTEQYGLDKILNRVPPKIKNAVLRKVADLSVAGGIEAAQEVVEGVLQRLTAISTFAPDMPVFEGIEREASAAAGAGAVARGLVGLLPGRQSFEDDRSPAKEPAATPAPPPIVITPEIAATLTPEDRASAIPDQMILEGRQILADSQKALAGTPVSEAVPPPPGEQAIPSRIRQADEVLQPAPPVVSQIEPLPTADVTPAAPMEGNAPLLEATEQTVGPPPQAEIAPQPGLDTTGLVPVTAGLPPARSSLQDDSSWVIRNKATGEVIMETFDRKKVDALNTSKYEAVPIQQYLAGLNRKAKAEAQADPTPEDAVSTPQIQLKKDGTPWKTIGEAKLGGRNRFKGYEPVQVEGGWGLTPPSTSTASPVSAPAQSGVSDSQGADVQGEPRFALSNEPPPPRTPDENIKTARSAIERVITEKADEPFAVHRKALGWVGFHWGDRTGGIEHLIEQRIAKDGMTREQAEAVARVMPETVAKGVIGPIYENVTGKVVRNVVWRGHTAVLGLVRAGMRQHWVLTGFEGSKFKPGTGRVLDEKEAEQKIADAARPVQRLPSGATQTELQADLKRPASKEAPERIRPEQVGKNALNSHPGSPRSLEQFGSGDAKDIGQNAEENKTRPERSISGSKAQGPVEQKPGSDSDTRPAASGPATGGKVTESAGPNNATGETKPSQRVADRAPNASRTFGDAETTKLRESLTEELRSMDPRGRIALRLVERIKAVIDGKHLEADGQYMRGLIEVSLNASRNPRHILNHEVIHALRDLGVIKPDEWTALVRAAKREKDLLAKIERAYADQGLSEDKILEEVVAEMHAGWRAGKDQKGLIRDAFKRISAVLEALGNWLRGNGYNSVESVFGAIDQGEIGGRDGAETTAEIASFALPRDADGRFASPSDTKYQKPKGTLAQQKAISKAIAQTKGGLWSKVQETYTTLRERLREDFIWATADEFHGLRRLGKYLAPKSADRELGSYVAARLARHSAGQIEAFLRYGAPKWDADEAVLGIDDSIPGFYDIVAPLYQKGLENLFEGYAYARRVKTQKLIEQGKEHNMTAEEVDQVLELANEYPEFKTVFDGIQKYKKAVLDMAQEMGLVNAEQRKVWEQADHVPFYRAVEDEKTGPIGGRGLAGQSDQVKRLTGGEEMFAVINPETGEVVDRFDTREKARLSAQKNGRNFKVEKAGQPIVGVIENIAKNFTHLIDASMKNHAAQLAVDEAVEAGWAEPVAMEQTQAIVPRAAMAKALERAGVKVGAGAEGVDAVAAIQSPVHPGNNVVAVRRDGKVEYYRVDDPLVYRALAGMHRVKMGWWTRKLSALKVLFTRGITAMPDFMAKNFIRDSQSAWLISEDRGYNIAEQMGKSIKALGTSMKDPRVKALMAAGGDTGWYQNAPEDVVKQLRQMESDGTASIVSYANPGKLLKTWERLGRAAEIANRMVAYDSTLKATGSKRQAAFEAADLMDFQLKGGNDVIIFLTEITPFLNARIQGLYKLGRVGGAAVVSKAAAKSLVAKAGILFGFHVLLAVINAEDDEYNDLPEHVKDANTIIPLHRMFDDETLKATGLPRFLLIPKPFELGLLLGTVPERAVQYLAGNDRAKDTWSSLQSAVLDTLAFNPVGNPLFKESVEQWANRSFFTGSPIVNQTLQYLPPEQQYTSGTSQTAKAIAKGMPDFMPDGTRSPVRIEHAVRGFTGTMGMELLAIIDSAMRAFGEAPPAVAKRLDEMPVVKSFIRQDPARNTKWLDRFYEAKQEADEIMKGVRAQYVGGEKEAGREVMRENAGLLKMRPVLDKASDAIGHLNREMRKIRDDEDLTPEQKRQKLEPLMERRNRYAKTYAKQAEAAME